MKKFYIMFMALAMLAPLHAAMPAPLYFYKDIIKRVQTESLSDVAAAVTGRGQANILDTNRKHLLIFAIERGNIEIVKLLLEKGADSDGRDSEANQRKTALMKAIELGKVEIVKALLEAGADVNLKDNQGKTALIHANENNNIEIANLLKQHGASTGLSQRQKGLALATLTAVVVGTVGIKLRTYQRTKKILAKKYKLGNLTKLQDTIWLATLLASYRMPWRLHALVRNNPGSLESLVGKDPQALAELYYGHTPSQAELDTFIQTFFAGIE